LEKTPTKTLALDIVLSGFVFYCSIWVYELSNYFVLKMTGADVYLSIQGILPVGVTAVSTASPAFPYTKFLQVVVCASIAVATMRAIEKRDFPFTKIALITVVSMYVASLQWEILPRLSNGAEVVHEESFFLLTLLLGALAIASFGKQMRLEFR
jgi:hypothetical protein